MPGQHASPRRPDSAVSPIVGLVGVAGFSLALWLLLGPGHGLTLLTKTLVLIMAAVLPMIALEVFVFRVYRRVLVLPAKPPDIKRVAVKLLGLYAVYAAIGVAYWLFPQYHTDFYGPFFTVLEYAWIVAAVLAVPYFVWMDGRIAEPYDGSWHAGMAVLGRYAEVDAASIGQFLRTWLVKAFFLPVMFSYTFGSTRFLLHALETGALFDPDHTYKVLYQAIFLVDLVAATTGYVLTLRILDSHVRSAEPTVSGWLVAIICYKPFWLLLVYTQYLQYDGDGIGWGDWLYTSGPFHWLWAAGILALSLLYLWAEISFGLRFSNLTHRGILTAGPYAITKHPAYISKNITWWMIGVPFVTTGTWADVVRNSLLMLGVNIIYYFRARTEERHLAFDPVYVQYAQWMAQHGLFRKAGEWFPQFFAFRWHDPQAARIALGWQTQD